VPILFVSVAEIATESLRFHYPFGLGWEVKLVTSEAHEPSVDSLDKPSRTLLARRAWGYSIARLLGPLTKPTNHLKYIVDKLSIYQTPIGGLVL
jgi:hypothetical protein